MHRFIFALLIAASGAVRAAPPADDSLFRDFGGKPGLAALMADFVGRVKADALVGPQFKDVKAAHLAQELTDQLCQLAGGPCVYEGDPMPQAHHDHAITRADFNRVVERLQDAMDARGIPFATQNRMLALLAPMHREIVNR